MPVKFTNPFAKTAEGTSGKHVIRLRDDPVDAEERDNLNPRREQPPRDSGIKLDRRIKFECLEIVPINELKRNARNAKKHPEKQIALLQENIEQFGFTTPLLVDENNEIMEATAA